MLKTLGPYREQLRENAPQHLATATFLLAGYGIGSILTTILKALLQ